MNAKEFLSQGWEIEKEIRIKEERIARYKQMSISVGGSSLSAFSTARTKRNDGRYTDYIERFVTLEEEICDQKARLMKVEGDVSRTVSALADRRYRTILEMRYLLYKRWEDIASILGYSEKHTIRLHRDALREVEKYIQTNNLNRKNLKNF